VRKSLPQSSNQTNVGHLVGLRRLHRARLISPITVLALLAVACGSGDDGPSDSSTVVPTPVETTSTAADAAAPEVTTEPPGPMQSFDGSEVGFTLTLPADWLVVDLIDSVPVDAGGLVTDVVSGSPAEGHLEPLDIVTGVDGVDTPTTAVLQQAILSRVPGEILIFSVLRFNAAARGPEPLEIPIELGTHPDTGGPFLGIVFEPAPMRREFDALAGLVPQTELAAFQLGTSDLDKLVAVAPSGNPALGVSVRTELPIPNFDVIEANFHRFVRSAGGVVTATERTTVNGREALRSVSHRATAIAQDTTVFSFAVRTDERLVTLQFFTTNATADGPTIGGIVAGFSIVD